MSAMDIELEDSGTLGPPTLNLRLTVSVPKLNPAWLAYEGTKLAVHQVCAH